MIFHIKVNTENDVVGMIHHSEWRCSEAKEILRVLSPPCRIPQGMRRPLSQGTTGGTQVERHWARGEKKYLTKVKLRKVK